MPPRRCSAPLGAASLSPCAAADFQGAAAYQELLNRSDPSGIVVIDGRRYMRAPQGVGALPGGYDGGFKTKPLRLSNGRFRSSTALKPRPH